MAESACTSCGACCACFRVEFSVYEMAFEGSDGCQRAGAKLGTPTLVAF